MFMMLVITGLYCSCGSCVKTDILQSVKYLGFHVNSDLTDNIDIQKQVKSLYCAANKLKYQFSKCSLEVKNYSFQHFCMPFYGSHLECNQ